MKKLPMWSVLSRISALMQFKKYWNEYTEHASTIPRRKNLGTFPTDDQGNRARDEINLRLSAITEYLGDTRCIPLIAYREPPMVGGRVMNINALENIFNLAAFEIPTNTITDYIERSIGHYRRDVVPSLIRTINPLWWLWMLLSSIIALPFFILDWAGYDRAAAESSKLGQFFKFIAAISVILAGFVSFFDDLTQLLINVGMGDRIDAFISSIGNIFK